VNGNLVISSPGTPLAAPYQACQAVVVCSPQRQRRPFLTYDENFCRAPILSPARGNVQRSSNGRASIAIGGYSLVAYLMNVNQIFLFVSDVNVLFGVGEPQTAVSSQYSLKGAYAGFATNPVGFGVTVFSASLRRTAPAPRAL